MIGCNQLTSCVQKILEISVGMYTTNETLFSQLEIWSDCRIPQPSHYMCRCPLKNEVYSKFSKMQMSGVVFCNLHVGGNFKLKIYFPECFSKW